MAKENLKKCENNRQDCPITQVLSRVGDKWSMLTIVLLGEHGTLRFNALHEQIGTISQKMLTVTLKALEADGLVSRKMYPQIPPRVEYSLTSLGESLVPPLMVLYDWANASMPGILEARATYGKKVKAGKS